MVNNNAHTFAELASRYKQLQKQTPDIVGIIAVALFKESFQRHGKIIGPAGGTDKWKTNGGPPSRKGAAPLIKRGNLRRSIRYSKGSNKVIISSNTPYSKIHNDGGVLPVTAKMRSFFWAMVYKNWNKGVTYDIKTKQLDSKARSQKYGPEAQFWLRLAFAKTITIPARPFIYDTAELGNRLNAKFSQLINNLITQRI